MTPPWLEQVPERLFEQLKVLSLQTADGDPHGAERGYAAASRVTPFGPATDVGLRARVGGGVGVERPKRQIEDEQTARIAIPERMPENALTHVTIFVNPMQFYGLHESMQHLDQSRPRCKRLAKKPARGFRPVRKQTPARSEKSFLH